jgi:flagellar biosynthetic protein FliO
MKLQRTIVAAGLAILAVNAWATVDAGQAYRVQKGDGLDAIARRHHTNRTTLLHLNPLLAPDSLDVGTVIRVPGTPSAAAHHSVPAGGTANKAPAARHQPVASRPQPVHYTTVPATRRPAPAKSPAPVLHLVANRPLASAARTKAVAPQGHAAVGAKPTLVAHAAAGTAKPFLPDYKDPKKDENEVPMGRVIVDLIWKLALVLGIAYLSIYALRGLMGRQPAISGQKGRLKVLESATLGPNRAVHLVRVGNKILVLGSTPDQITAIGEVDDVDAVAQVSAPVAQAFAGHLAEAVAGEKGGALPEQFHGGVRYIWERVQEIRGLRGKGPNA